MRSQTPESNNPANPLDKVAALTIERVYPVETQTNKFRVLARLNFKKSADMRGHAKTTDGTPVTVSFTLERNPS